MSCVESGMRVRCAYCDHIFPGENYCEVRGRCMSDHEVNAPRKCGSWAFNPMHVLTLEMREEPEPSVEPCETLPLFGECG